MGKPLIFNIQKYSIHDGGGIRTTVFFKGCPLSCRWCHNPESQRFEKELLFHGDRCKGCGACSLACARKAVSMEGLPSVIGISSGETAPSDNTIRPGQPFSESGIGQEPGSPIAEQSAFAGDSDPVSPHVSKP